MSGEDKVQISQQAEEEARQQPVQPTSTKSFVGKLEDESGFPSRDARARQENYRRLTQPRRGRR